MYRRSRPASGIVARYAVDAGGDAPRCWLAPDEHSGFLTSNRDSNTLDVFSIARSSPGDDFIVTAMPSTSTTDGNETRPFVTADGLTMFLARTAPGSAYKIAYATRSSQATTFGALTNASGINDSANNIDAGLYLLPTGEAFFASTRLGTLGGTDLFSTTRNGTSFSAPSALLNVNTDNTESSPVVSADNRTLFFSSNPLSQADIYVATRTSTSQAFGTPMLVDALDTSSDEYPLWLSADGCVLYIVRDGDIHVTTRAE